jgi:dUTP pyrophosphatase
MKIKLLNNLAKIPTKGSKEAAGYDLYAATDYDIEIQPSQTVKVDTGIAMAIPDGYFGAIFARSGLATKQGLRPANCVGVVDSDYRGPVIVALHNDSERTQVVSAGDRIAQLVILPYKTELLEIVDELDDTERGKGGFGSTGK